MQKLVRQLLVGAATCALAQGVLIEDLRANDLFDGDVVSFGDSLSDAGNVFALTGGLSPDPTVFQGGNRFVNPGGLTWIEQLLGGTPNLDGTDATSPQSVFFAGGGVDGDVNAALGGAFAGSGNLGAGLPGVTESLGAFAAAGGTIEADDTVTYWAGANNFFVGLPTVTDAAGAAALGQSVAGIATTDIATIAAGAVVPGGGPGQVIVVNLPDFGVLPGTNADAAANAAAAAAAVAGAGGDAAAQAEAAAAAAAATLGGASIASDNYNAALAAGVTALAAANPGINFVQLDAASVFDEIIADPAAFGFANVTDACLLDADCASADFETQNTFLFADDVHPTNAGYALLAELARQTLDPTSTAATASGIADVPLAGRQFVSDLALDRARSFFFAGRPSGVASSSGPDVLTDQASGVRGEGFIEALASTGTVDERGVTPEVDFDLYGLRLGADIFQSEHTVIGAQGSFTTGNGSQPLVDFEPNTISFDLYAAHRIGQAFAAVSIGGGYLSIDNIERSPGVATLVNTADTEGTQFNVVGEVGYDFKLGGVTLLPSASVGYFRTDVDGYVESGVFAPLEIGDRNINAVSGSVNVRAAKAFSNGDGLSGHVFAGVGYEDFLLYDSNELSARALASTAAASTVSIDDPDGRGFVFDVGMRVNLNEGFAVAADYELGINSGETRSHRGNLRLIARF